jgi:hypothetical protein
MSVDVRGLSMEFFTEFISVYSNVKLTESKLKSKWETERSRTT